MVFIDHQIDKEILWKQNVMDSAQYILKSNKHYYKIYKLEITDSFQYMLVTAFVFLKWT